MNDTVLNRNDRKWLKKYLATGVAVVNFTKKNGEPRTMVCTLKNTLIPGDKLPDSNEDHPRRQPNPDVQVVFDLEVGEWRSFRLDSVNWYMEEDDSVAA